MMAMAMKSIAARLRDQVRNFAAAREGNIAVIFALASLPVVGLMGAAVDYSRANAVKTDMQSALDATALMVSKSAPTMTNDQLQTAAKAYFTALFKNPEGFTTAITASYAAANSTVTVNGTTSVKSDFIGIMGKQFAHMPVNAFASVSWGSSRLRVALALDNTGSMASSNKMTALKTAAKNLLAQLQSAAQKNGDVYVSIVPFSKDVNVGKDSYTATWIDWTEWDKKSHGTCSRDRYDGDYKECIDHDKTWTPANHNTWNGCVADRSQDFDVVASTPDPTKKTTMFFAEQYAECPVSLMPLSYDWTALKNKIDSMQPNGNTNVTIGLSLAWQTLIAGAPFPAPAEDPKYKYQKVIILLTDGENTQNRFSTSQTSIDARTKLACANAKAAGVTIYTVLVMEGTQSLLQACATDAKKYFYLQSATGLVTAFNQIGTDLTNLRVSK
jgi:Flp pilus assembly protein TadG